MSKCSSTTGGSIVRLRHTPALTAMEVDPLEPYPGPVGRLERPVRRERAIDDPLGGAVRLEGGRFLRGRRLRAGPSGAGCDQREQDESARMLHRGSGLSGNMRLRVTGCPYGGWARGDSGASSLKRRLGDQSAEALPSA